MAKIEQISNINVIRSEEMEEDSNNSFTESSSTINKQPLNSIQSLLLQLDRYPLKKLDIKTEIECFYSQINNCSIKERLVLETLLKINQSCSNSKKPKVLSYKDIVQSFNDKSKKKNSYYNEDYFNIDNKIFNEIDTIVHKTLHKKTIVDGKSVKICSIYNDLNTVALKEKENFEYIDKLINTFNKRGTYKNMEFLAIKTIVVALINLTEELINNYFIKSTEINLSNIMEEEYYFSEDGDNNESSLIIFKPNLFETILNDYVFTSNMCPFLENYFIESFNNFREKYQISFSLSELFTDIFWNCIFHNKILSNKFISIYIGNDNCCKNIRIALSKIIKIISDTSFALKSKVLQLLSLNYLENKNDIDLMTAIVELKNTNRDLIKNENIISHVNNKMGINQEYMEFSANNNNDNNNTSKKESKNNSEIKMEKKEKNENNDKKENKVNELNESDLEHKTVDELYNYINDNQGMKSKKKKRTKKKKAKKMENKNKEFIEDNDNKANEEDLVVKQFKIDLLQKVVNANEINKIKPVLSDKWIQMISNL